MEGKSSELKHYYNGSIQFFGDEHRPYAIVAILLFFMVNIFPMLLLLVYPCSCFHKCLNKTQCRWHSLHIFMDAMLGSYSHKPRERRYFGAFYLLVRMLHVLAVMLLAPLVFVACASYILILSIVLVAFCRPYKNRWHNVIDISLFLILLNACLTFSFFYESLFVSPLYTYNISGKLYFYNAFVLISLILLYGVGYFTYRILPFPLIKKLLGSVYKCCCCHRCLKKHAVELEETLPHRMERSETEPLLM